MFPPLFTLNLLSRQLLPRLPAGILSLFHAATPRILILSNCTMIWWRVQETKHVKWNILRTLLPICFGSRCVLVPQFCSAAISHKVFQIFGIVSLQDISSMLPLKSKQNSSWILDLEHKRRLKHKCRTSYRKQNIPLKNPFRLAFQNQKRKKC